MPTASRTITRSFASDNNAGVHPEIIEAIARANQGHVVAYGDDPYTRSAIAKFEEHFGSGIDIFFTFNGTGANVLGLQALNRPYHAVLCSDYAHIYTRRVRRPREAHRLQADSPASPGRQNHARLGPPRLPRHRRPAPRAGPRHFDHPIHRDGNGLPARRNSIASRLRARA